MIKKVSIFSISSSLHSEVAENACDEPFINSVVAACPQYSFCFPEDFGSYGTSDIDLIYVRTGGTEGIFRAAFPALPDSPVRLLTSGDSNSLAASMEILSYIRQRGHRGEILHGPAEMIAAKMKSDPDVADVSCGIRTGALKKFDGVRAGIVGRPSDWLISSDVDPVDARENLGVELVDIPISELIDDVLASGVDMRGFDGAEAIHRNLENIVAKYSLSAVTVRCFDLLKPLGNTGCLALARLNAAGIPAACEGDVPALLSMMVARRETGLCGFQANPARIDPVSGEIVFAHCTVPLDMVSSLRYTTHFESGIGVAIKGEIPTGPVTILKIGPDARTRVCFKAELIGNLCERNLCRTQIVVRCPEAVDYFLGSPIGNHHIIVPGHIDI